MQVGGGGAPAVRSAARSKLRRRRPTARARDAIEALSGARADGRRDLATATRPSAQAAAAVGLRRSACARAASSRTPSPPSARALRRTAAAYGGARRAPRRPATAARYARAATAVASAERDLERLIGSIL